MSNLDIQYLGADAVQLRAENPDVVRQIDRYFKRRAEHAAVRIYVYPRSFYDSKLEWAAVITSPTGRNTLTIKQRVPAGSITFEHISNHETTNQLQPANTRRQGHQANASRWFPTANTRAW